VGGIMYARSVEMRRWFSGHRAGVLAGNRAAFGLGGVLVNPVLSNVVQAWGWRLGAAIGGVFFLVIGVPLCSTIRRSPESMGLLPDGDEPARPTPDKDSPRQTVRSEVEVTLGEALRSFAFWGSVLAAGIRNGSYHAVSVSFGALIVWKELSPSESALVPTC